MNKEGCCWVKRCWTEWIPNALCLKSSLYQHDFQGLVFSGKDFVSPSRSFGCEGFVLHSDVEKLHTAQDADAHFALFNVFFFVFFHRMKALELVEKNPSLKQWKRLHTHSYIHTSTSNLTSTPTHTVIPLSARQTIDLRHCLGSPDCACSLWEHEARLLSRSPVGAVHLLGFCSAK